MSRGSGSRGHLSRTWDKWDHLHLMLEYVLLVSTFATPKIMDFSPIIPKIKPSIGFVFVVRGADIVGTGSGFVFWKKGIFVTCNHVIEAVDTKIFIKFPDVVDPIEATVIIQDKEHDLALLKFVNDTIEPLKKGDEASVKEGVGVLIAGYPLSMTSLTTHYGILSCVTKDETGIETYLIDGSINPGNSGCPLMNLKGEVIGVVNATRREQSKLLSKVENMKTGAVSLYGIDLVTIYKALISNLQLGIGYAVPCGYIPSHATK